jgi:hypothetical protein
VRTKVYRKNYGWSVRLVYDPRGLPGVMTVRPRVAGVLQIPTRSPPPMQIYITTSEDGAPPRTSVC